MKNKIHFLGQEKGENSLTLSTIAIDNNDTRTVIDPGRGMIVDEIKGSQTYGPDLSSIQDGKKIDRVLSTHGHMDHTSFTPVLCNLGMLSDKARIYGTPQTNSILGITSWDDLNKGADDFDFMDHVNMTERLRELAHPGENNIEGESIFADPNGHMVGSTSYKFRTPSGRVFMFLGDTCLHDQPTVGGAVQPSEYPKEWIPDEMTTDLTYASGGMGEDKTYDQKVEELDDAVITALNQGRVVVCQGFASGKIPNLAHNLSSLGIPCWIDSALAWKLLDVYHNKVWSDKDAILPAPGNGTGINRVMNRNHRYELMKDNEPKIIIATGGMGDFGPILDWYEHGLSNDNFLFVATSWLAPGSNGARLVELGSRYPNFSPDGEVAKLRFQKNRKSPTEWREFPVRAQVRRFGLSSHGTFGDFVNFLVQLIDVRGGRPLERIFLLHGTPGAKRRAKEELTRLKFAKEVIDPTRDLPDQTIELI